MTYDKTKWVNNNSVIRATDMNHIEEGIEEVLTVAKQNEININAIREGTPEKLNSLKKIADALGNDDNFMGTFKERTNAISDQIDLTESQIIEVKVNGESQQNFNFIEREKVNIATYEFTGATSITKIENYYRFVSNTSNASKQVINTEIGKRYIVLLKFRKYLGQGQSFIYKVNGDIIFSDTTSFPQDNFIDIRRSFVATSTTTNIEVSRVTGGIYGFDLKDYAIFEESKEQWLNVEPSIKALNTTDTNGVSKKLLLSTDSQHVEMATGRTLEEDYTALLKQHGKEFTSTGSAISVNNGIKGKVLSGSLSGQTLKNEILTNNTMFDLKSQNSKIFEINLSKPKQYTCIFNINRILNITDDADAGNTIYLWLSALGKTGVAFNKGLNKFVCTLSSETVTSFQFARSDVDTKYPIVDYIMIIEGDWTNKDVGHFTGLSSTQAIINNNGQRYEFYEPTITGKTRILKAAKGTQNWTEIQADEVRDTVTYDYKLESVAGDLGSTTSAYDYIDRARKVKVVNTKDIVLDGSESGFLVYRSGDYTSFLLTNCIKGIVSTDSGICNNLLVNNSVVYSNTGEACWLHVNGSVYLSVLSSKLTTKDAQGFKKYLTSNPVTIRYQLATPIEIPLTDEEFAQYDAFKKVILCNGVGGVNDTFEIKEDGNGLFNNNVFTSKLSKFKIDALSGTILSNTIQFRVLGLNKSGKGSGTKGACDKFTYEVGYGDTEHVYVVKDYLWVHLLKSKFGYTEGDSKEVYIAKAESYLNSVIGDITLTYELATPITTTIDKSIMPTIQTADKINIFSVDSSVAPSSLTLNVPVDRIGEIEARIEEVERSLMSILPVHID